MTRFAVRRVAQMLVVLFACLIAVMTVVALVIARMS